jgi:hypothetical protein
MMTEYRKRKGSDTWHWIESCRWYPSKRYTGATRDKRPHGDLCNECRAKEKRQRSTSLGAAFMRRSVGHGF